MWPPTWLCDLGGQFCDDSPLPAKPARASRGGRCVCDFNDFAVFLYSDRHAPPCLKPRAKCGLCYSQWTHR